MSNELTSSDRLSRELTTAINAAIGVVIIRCPDTETFKVVDEVYALAASEERAFKMHHFDKGICTYPKPDLANPQSAPFDPLSPLSKDEQTIPVNRAFAHIWANPDDSSITLFGDLHSFLADPMVQSCIRRQVQFAREHEGRVFIVVPETAEIPDAVSSIVHLIEYQYPALPELADTFDMLKAGMSSSLSAEEINETFDEHACRMIASAGSGMTLTAFENAIALAITDFVNYVSDTGTLEGISPEYIIDRLSLYKVSLLKRTNVLELLKAVPMDEIGGLDVFKEWIAQRARTYDAEALDAGITPSKGVMVVGPPGCGKSLIAKASGSALGLQVIRLDIGRVFGSFIGQSETTMRSVLKMIDAIAPCVLMLDEIDKGFAGMMGGASGDSGTSQRVFGTFLTWMQERDQRRKPIFLVMTANRIEGLPPEFTRKGRIDETFGVGAPNDAEREEVIRIHAEKRGYEFTDELVTYIAERTANYVPAEIEGIIEDTIIAAYNADSCDDIGTEFADMAIAGCRPMFKSRASEFSAMTAWIEANARPASSHPIKSAPTKTNTFRAVRRPKVPKVLPKHDKK